MVLYNFAVFRSTISVNVQWIVWVWLADFFQSTCVRLLVWAEIASTFGLVKYWVSIGFNSLQWALMKMRKKERSRFKSSFCGSKKHPCTFGIWERKVQVYFLEFSCFGLPNLNWLPLICLEKHPFMPNWFSLRGRDKIFVHDIDDYLGNDKTFHQHFTFSVSRSYVSDSRAFCGRE